MVFMNQYLILHESIFDFVFTSLDPNNTQAREANKRIEKHNEPGLDGSYDVEAEEMMNASDGDVSLLSIRFLEKKDYEKWRKILNLFCPEWTHSSCTLTLGHCGFLRSPKCMWRHGMLMT